jgi:hypothetical protein
MPTEEYNAMKANEAQKEAKAEAEAQAILDNVRFIPSEQVEKCQYIDQTSGLAKLSFFGVMEKTEENAKNKLKVAAAKLGGDSVKIKDRLHDKGRGGSDITSLTIYGDVYKCSK